jgi:hypothetical protein
MSNPVPGFTDQTPYHFGVDAVGKSNVRPKQATKPVVDDR